MTNGLRLRIERKTQNKKQMDLKTNLDLRPKYQNIKGLRTRNEPKTQLIEKENKNRLEIKMDTPDKIGCLKNYSSKC